MNKRLSLSSAALHIIAMTIMLMDHLWATLLPGQNWLTCVGRIAFPIFAFMTVEGYFHTHDVKRYMLRLLVFALISELPFNLMYSGTLIYPYHQNVLWTLLLGLFGIWLMERAKGKVMRYVLTAVAVVLVSVCLATLGMVDYFAPGVLTVFAFYFFRGKKWWCILGQIVAMYWINIELLGGQYYPISLFGIDFELCEQGLALLALIPIWLYHGRQGHHSKAFKWTCYAFYPVHMLLLGLAVKLI